MTARTRISKRDAELLQKLIYFSSQLDTPYVVPLSLLFDLYAEILHSFPHGAISHLLRTGLIKYADKKRKKVRITLPPLRQRVLYGESVILGPQAASEILKKWAAKNNVKLQEDAPGQFNPFGTSAAGPKKKPGKHQGKKSEAEIDLLQRTALHSVPVDQILTDLLSAKYLANQSLPHSFVLAVIKRHTPSEKDPAIILRALERIGLLKKDAGRRAMILWNVTQPGRQRYRKSKLSYSFTPAEQTQIVRGKFWSVEAEKAQTET